MELTFFVHVILCIVLFALYCDFFFPGRFNVFFCYVIVLCCFIVLCYDVFRCHGSCIDVFFSVLLE